MSLRVPVESALLVWACERNRRDVEDYAAGFPKLADWVAQRAQPTLKQLERFAKATSTPVGYFFLAVPPDERLPVHDFRTRAGGAPSRPSPELLDTLRDCQERQDWFRDFARTAGEARLAFVGSANVRSDVVKTAALMREKLDFDVEARRSMRTWEEALTRLASAIETAGILVMRSGIVGNNTSRPLDPDEFRGFALADDLAPLIFVNAADTKAAQIFTLAHELAHVWLGSSGVSDEHPDRFDGDDTERWCNQVAAELLVPLAHFEREAAPRPDLAVELPRLARVYKVSTLVILRRLFEAHRLSRAAFREGYAAELARLTGAQQGSGGDFYRTLPARVSPRFARAVVASALEGQTLFRDAYRMLGIHNSSTFDGLVDRHGLM